MEYLIALIAKLHQFNIYDVEEQKQALLPWLFHLCSHNSLEKTFRVCIIMWNRQDMGGLLLPYISIAGASSNFDSFLVKNNSFICECILTAVI